jgi:alpha-beta hydrolase superfamily lysophospholipase
MWPTHPPCFINFHISFGSQKIWLILSMGGWSDDRYFGYITRKNIIKKQTLGKWRERERERERERVAKPYCSHSITNQRLTRNCQKAFWELHESSTHWH